ncbi:threonine/serine exporter family protein [Bacillus sp. CGMCC 1.16541]|uniref:threonine/serine exporter family protein n=1 Tax=Bacillus sp. CGMCC 1.16541 TaxID=2185143 RepID=UPI000D72BD02|nr:threonine/serine exporter family protein [Bacillus sp. CGMCC 1.16541]
MVSNQNQTYEIIEVCLLAGKIMLESGAETGRVEDTMTRIAASFGINDAHSYVTPTGIVFSANGMAPAKLIRISERTTDLRKVTLVNSISRNISGGQVSLQEAHQLLEEIKDRNLMFPIWVQIAAASISSGCFLIMFDGLWQDFIPAMIAGGIGFSCLLYLHYIVQIKFFAEFSASLVIGFLSFLFIQVGIGHELDKIIIGSVMPLVPGLLITNAVRDLMSGHLVSGISKGAEAFLTASAIGSGIAVVLSFFN